MTRGVHLRMDPLSNPPRDQTVPRIARDVLCVRFIRPPAAAPSGNLLHQSTEIHRRSRSGSRGRHFYVPPPRQRKPTRVPVVVARVGIGVYVNREGSALKGYPQQQLSLQHSQVCSLQHSADLQSHSQFLDVMISPDWIQFCQRALSTGLRRRLCSTNSFAPGLFFRRSRFPLG